MLLIREQEQRALSFGLQCYYCEIKLSENKDDFDKITRNAKTIDHIIPISKGGANSIHNKVWCCRDCNHLKDNLNLDEFHNLLQTLGKNDRYRYDIMLKNVRVLLKHVKKNKRRMLKKKINKHLINEIDKLKSRHEE